MIYDTTISLDSKNCPGVRFEIKRISFGSRLTLMRQIRDLLRRIEFHAAGETPVDNLEASILAAEMDRIFFLSATVSVSGLRIDGREPELEIVYEHGPEALTREIIDAIKREASLSEEETKN